MLPEEHAALLVLDHEVDASRGNRRLGTCTVTCECEGVDGDLTV